MTKATMKPSVTKGSQHVRGVTQNRVEIIGQSDQDFQINAFKINTQKKQVATNQEQTKILEMFFETLQQCFRWRITQGPVRKRKISLGISNKKNIPQGMYYTGDRGMRRQEGAVMYPRDFTKKQEATTIPYG